MVERVTQAGPDRVLSKIVDERARFHQVLFDIADNEELNRVLPTARSHLFRNQFYPYLTRDDINGMAEKYQEIADAVLAMDGDRAEQAMRKHIVRTGERTLPRVKPHPAVKKDMQSELQSEKTAQLVAVCVRRYSLTAPVRPET